MKPATRRKMQSPKLRQQRVRSAGEARRLRKLQEALPAAPLAQRASARSAEALAEHEAIKETYMHALGMLGGDGSCADLVASNSATPASGGHFRARFAGAKIQGTPQP